MTEYLISLGSQIYLPHMPDHLVVSTPIARYEITDTPLITGKEYDQSRFVSRRAAEYLSGKYPDVWSILKVMKYRANPVEVEAREILEVRSLRPDGSRFLVLAGDSVNRDEPSALNVLADAAMSARIDIKVGDYWVKQADGYCYLNPKATFERKYSPVQQNSLLQGGGGGIAGVAGISGIGSCSAASTGTRTPDRPAQFSELWINEVTEYHPLDDDQLLKMKELRKAAKTFLWALANYCPPCADRTAAARHVRDALFTANASVALKGLV